MHRGDTSHAAEMSEQQEVRAIDLYRSGTVHHVVPEVEGESAEQLALAVAAECAVRLHEMTSRTP